MPNKDYYQSHREALCAKAREYSRQRTERLREHRESNPEDDTYRVKAREAYYAKRSARVKRRIEGWLSSPDVAEDIKSMLRRLVEEGAYKSLTMRGLKPFEAVIGE